jgi:cytochrome c biogenesis protein CcmG/thiol:disulfide interchange protein DsbE
VNARAPRWLLSKRPLQAAALALVAALLVLLTVRVVSDERADALAAEVAAGKQPPAPTFTLHRLGADGTLALGALRGKVVLLNFWASWCVPCKREAAVLERSWRRWREQGVVFVGVDAQDFGSDAQRFVLRHGITYPNVHDGPGTTSANYGVSGFPETWFVDRRGRLVVEHVSGPLTADRVDRDLRLALER